MSRLRIGDRCIVRLDGGATEHAATVVRHTRGHAGGYCTLVRFDEPLPAYFGGRRSVANADGRLMPECSDVVHRSLLVPFTEVA